MVTEGWSFFLPLNCDGKYFTIVGRFLCKNAELAVDFRFVENELCTKHYAQRRLNILFVVPLVSVVG
jgi:hypothetical protein